MKLGINLYTLRDLDEPLPDRLERVAKAGYDGIEFAAAHVPCEELETEFGTVVETYRELGCERLVVPTFRGASSRISAIERGSRRSASARRSGWNSISVGSLRPVRILLSFSIGTRIE